MKRSVLLVVLVGCGLAAPVSAAAPRTRITSMHLSEMLFTDAHGATRLRVIVRVGACGRAGRAAFHITEALSPAGQNRPVYARTKRHTTRAQPGACHAHRIAWTLQDKFLGVGRYRVSVRAKTSRRGWSHAVARHSDTID